MAVSLDESNQRQLQRKRETETVIAARQKEFDEKEANVIAHYQKRSLVKIIDTNPDRKVRVGRNELALRNRAFLQQVAAQMKKIVKGKIRRKK